MKARTALASCWACGLPVTAMYEKNDREISEFDTGDHAGARSMPMDAAFLGQAQPAEHGGDSDEGSDFHALIEQFQCMDIDCGKYATRFDVLCDYVLQQ